MNTLIIIGNGFDLAHGIKSSYDHFMLELIKRVLLEAVGTPGQKCQKGPFTAIAYSHITNIEETIKRSESLSDLFRNTQFKHNLKNSRLNVASQHSYLQLIIEGGFLKEILENYDKPNWIDIEREYQKRLLKYAKGNRNFKFGAYEELIFIKDEFNAYLKTEFDKFNIDKFKETYPKKYNQIESFLNPKTIYESGSPTGENHYEKLILNYNYTSTPELYSSRQKYTHLNLHGKLDEDNLIFGTSIQKGGDYESLTDLSTDIYNTVKNNIYPKRRELGILSKYINKGKFRVFIIGHSCGLPDIHSLKKVFSSKNCHSIILCFRDEVDRSNRINRILEHDPFNEDIDNRLNGYDESLRFL